MPASFTEQAILSVVDKSTPNIRKINAELKKLFATANQLKNITATIKINDKGITAASANIRKLSADLRSLQSVSRAITIRLNTTQAQQQIAALRAQAQRPVTLATRAGGGGGGGGRTLGALTGPGRFGVHVLGGTVGIAGYSIAALGAAIGRATREGIKQVDVGDTSLRALQLDRIVGPGTRKAVDAAIERIRKEQPTTPGGSLMNRGLISQTIAETMPLAGYDPRQAEWLAKQQIELIKLEVQRGRSLDDAREHAVKYVKALDLAGLLKNAEGVFDPVKAASYIDALKRIAPSIGKEFTGENVFQFMKYARQARYTATPETLMLGMLTSEEMGASSAGVALNQAVRQLLGLNVPKETLAQLEKHGLVTTKEVPSGTVGKSKKTKRVVDQPLDEEGLRANFWQFVNERMIPKMRAEGLDPAKPSDAAKYAARYTSTQTARDLLTGAITRMADLMNEARRAGLRDVGESVDPKSILIAAEGLTSQIKGVLGEAVNVFEPILIPGMQKVGGYMSDLAADMRKATEGDTKAQQRVEGTASKMLAATAGTALLMKGPIGQALTGAASAAGITAGVAGALAPGASQTAQSLAYAGISLNTAGQSLQAAGDMQVGVWGKLASLLGIATVAAPFVAAARDTIFNPATATPEESTKSLARIAAEEAVKRDAERLRKGEERLAKHRADLLSGAPEVKGREYIIEGDIKRTQEQMAAIRTEMQKNMAAIAANQPAAASFWKDFWTAVQQPKMDVTPLAEDFTKRAAERAQRERERKGAHAALPGILGGGPAISAGKPLPVELVRLPPRDPRWIPLPTPRPAEAPQRRNLPGILGGPGGKPLPVDVKSTPKTAAVEPPTTLTAALTRMQTEQPVWLPALQASNTGFSASVSTLTTTSGDFSRVFAAVPGQMASGGTAAADALAGRMPGLGASLGNAAGDALAARVSSMSINVNPVPGSKADTGAMKPI